MYRDAHSSNSSTGNNSTRSSRSNSNFVNTNDIPGDTIQALEKELTLAKEGLNKLVLLQQESNSTTVNTGKPSLTPPKTNLSLPVPPSSSLPTSTVVSSVSPSSSALSPRSLTTMDLNSSSINQSGAPVVTIATLQEELATAYGIIDTLSAELATLTTSTAVLASTTAQETIQQALQQQQQSQPLPTEDTHTNRNNIKSNVSVVSTNSSVLSSSTSTSAGAAWTSMNEIREQLTQARNECFEANKRVNTLQDICNGKDTSIQQLQGKMEEKDQKVRKLETEIQQQYQKYTTLETEYHTLEEKVLQLAGTSNTITTASATALEEAETEISSLRFRIEALTGLHETEIAELTRGYEETIVKLREEIDSAGLLARQEYETEINQLKETVLTLQGEQSTSSDKFMHNLNEAVEKVRASLNSEMERKEQMCKQYETQLQEQKRKEEQYKQEIADLKLRLTTVETESANKESIHRTERSEQQTSLLQLQTREKEYRDQLRTAEEKYTQLELRYKEEQQLKTVEIQQLQISLQNQVTKVQTLTTDMQKEKEKLYEYVDTQTKQDNRIQQQQKEVEEKSLALDHQTKLLEDKQYQIDQYIVALKEKDNHINQLQSMVAEKEQNIANMRSNLRVTETEAGIKLTKVMGEHQMELQQLKTTLTTEQEKTIQRIGNEYETKIQELTATYENKIVTLTLDMQNRMDNVTRTAQEEIQTVKAQVVKENQRYVEETAVLKQQYEQERQKLEDEKVNLVQKYTNQIQQIETTVSVKESEMKALQTRYNEEKLSLESKVTVLQSTTIVGSLQLSLSALEAELIEAKRGWKAAELNESTALGQVALLEAQLLDQHLAIRKLEHQVENRITQGIAVREAEATMKVSSAESVRNEAIQAKDLLQGALDATVARTQQLESMNTSLQQQCTEKEQTIEVLHQEKERLGIKVQEMETSNATEVEKYSKLLAQSQVLEAENFDLRQSLANAQKQLGIAQETIMNTQRDYDTHVATHKVLLTEVQAQAESLQNVLTTVRAQRVTEQQQAEDNRKHLETTVRNLQDENTKVTNQLTEQNTHLERIYDHIRLLEQILPTIVVPPTPTGTVTEISVPSLPSYPERLSTIRKQILTLSERTLLAERAVQDILQHLAKVTAGTNLYDAQRTRYQLQLKEKEEQEGQLKQVIDELTNKIVSLTNDLQETMKRATKQAQLANQAKTDAVTAQKESMEAKEQSSQAKKQLETVEKELHSVKQQLTKVLLSLENPLPSSAVPSTNVSRSGSPDHNNNGYGGGGASVHHRHGSSSFINLFSPPSGYSASSLPYKDYQRNNIIHNSSVSPSGIPLPVPPYPSTTTIAVWESNATVKDDNNDHHNSDNNGSLSESINEEKKDDDDTGMVGEKLVYVRKVVPVTNQVTPQPPGPRPPTAPPTAKENLVKSPVPPVKSPLPPSSSLSPRPPGGSNVIASSVSPRPPSTTTTATATGGSFVVPSPPGISNGPRPPAPRPPSSSAVKSPSPLSPSKDSALSIDTTANPTNNSTDTSTNDNPLTTEDLVTATNTSTTAAATTAATVNNTPAVVPHRRKNLDGSSMVSSVENSSDPLSSSILKTSVTSRPKLNFRTVATLARQQLRSNGNIVTPTKANSVTVNDNNAIGNSVTSVSLSSGNSQRRGSGFLPSSTLASLLQNNNGDEEEPKSSTYSNISNQGTVVDTATVSKGSTEEDNSIPSVVSYRSTTTDTNSTIVDSSTRPLSGQFLPHMRPLSARVGITTSNEASVLPTTDNTNTNSGTVGVSSTNLSSSSSSSPSRPSTNTVSTVRRITLPGLRRKIDKSSNDDNNAITTAVATTETVKEEGK